MASLAIDLDGKSLYYQLKLTQGSPLTSTTNLPFVHAMTYPAWDRSNNLGRKDHITDRSFLALTQLPTMTTTN